MSVSEQRTWQGTLAFSLSTQITGIDASLPGIDGIPTLVSDNTTPTEATIGDILTLSFSVTEVLKQDPASVLIAGETAVKDPSSSGQDYVYTATVTATSEEGSVTYAIGVLTDTADNTFDPPPVTLSSVTIDRTLPTISITNPSTGPSMEKTLSAVIVETNPLTDGYRYLMVSTTTCDGTVLTGFSGTVYTSGETLTLDSSFNNQYVCFRAEDLAGNTTFSLSTQITGIDASLPGIDGIPTLVSDNTTPTEATIGDILTLSFSVTEVLKQDPASVLIAGETAVKDPSSSGQDYVYTATVTATSEEGSVTYAIGVLTDTADNTFDPPPVTLSSVTIDRTLPTISITNPSTGPSMEKTLSAVIVETNPLTDGYRYLMVSTTSCDGTVLTGFSGTVYTSGETLTLDSSFNNQYVCFRAEDLAGNTTFSLSTQITGIDVSLPGIDGIPTLVSDNTTPTEATIGDILTLSFSVTEVLKQDPASVLIAGETAVKDPSSSGQDYVYTATVTATSEEGSVTYAIGVLTDTADNTFDPPPVTLSSVTIDRTLPTISITNPSTGPSMEKTLSAVIVETNPLTDGYRYLMVSTTTCDGTVLTGFSGTVYTSGETLTLDSSFNNQYVCFRAEDLAGNTTFSLSTQITGIDASLPGIDGIPTLVSDNTTPTEATIGDILTLSFSVTEVLKQDPASVLIAGETAVKDPSSSGQDYVYTATVTATSEEGSVTYAIGVLTDTADNTFDPPPVTLSSVTIDRTLPTISITNPSTGPSMEKTLSAVIVETNPLTDGYRYLMVSTTTCDGTVLTGFSGTVYTSGETLTLDSSFNNQYVCFRAEDLAGNTTFSLSTQITGIDASLPGIDGIPTLVSDNTTPTEATIGDILTLSFSVTEVLKQDPASVLIAGETAVKDPSSSGQDYVYTATVTATSEEGSVTYAIGVLTDTADNTFDPPPVTLSSVTIDRTLPTISITNPSTGPSMEKTLSAVIVETNPLTDGYRYLMVSTTTCDGTVLTGFSGTVYTSGETLTLDSSFNNQYVCFRAEDLAGNTTFSLSTQITGIDASLPGIDGIPTLVSDNTTPTEATIGDILTLSFSVTEVLKQDPASVLIAGETAVKDPSSSGQDYVYTATVTATSEEGSVTYAIGVLTDTADNTFDPPPVTLSSVTIDRTLPTISITNPSTGPSMEKTLSAVIVETNPLTDGYRYLMVSTTYV